MMLRVQMGEVTESRMDVSGYANLGTKCSRGLTNCRVVMCCCITAGREPKGGSRLSTREDGPDDGILGRPMENFRFLGRPRPPRILLSVKVCVSF